MPARTLPDRKEDHLQPKKKPSKSYYRKPPANTIADPTAREVHAPDASPGDEARARSGPRLSAILVSVLKMFKYLRLNEQTNMLWAVLTRAGRDIAFFMFTLFMFLSAFIIIGMQLLGSSIEGFIGFVDAFSMLMQMILGIVDMYNDLIVAAGPYGALFFYVFIIFMFLILINVFLAILNDAYGWVKEQAEEKAQEAIREQEEREAQGIVDEKVSRRDKARALAAAARGRYRRFKNRVKSLRLRKRTAPPTGISDF